MIRRPGAWEREGGTCTDSAHAVRYLGVDLKETMHPLLLQPMACVKSGLLHFTDDAICRKTDAVPRK